MATSDFTLQSNPVTIVVPSDDEGPWKTALDYCEDELSGSYCWDHDLVWSNTNSSDMDKLIFFFSDPDAAFQFKMRFA